MGNWSTGASGPKSKQYIFIRQFLHTGDSTTEFCEDWVRKWKWPLIWFITPWSPGIAMQFNYPGLELGHWVLGKKITRLWIWQKFHSHQKWQLHGENLWLGKKTKSINKIFFPSKNSFLILKQQFHAIFQAILLSRSLLNIVSWSILLII